MLKKYVFILFILSTSLPPVMAQTISTVEIERQICELTNKERKARGLEPLTFNSSLAELARIQSQNMLKHGFFSHTDHLGRSPGDRKDIYFPKLFGGVGENIAYIYGISPRELAQKFMEEWMNSPGHKANILNKSYNYLGVGVVTDGETYYATQVFGNLVAEMVSDVAESYSYGSNHEFKFRFFGKFPKDKLTIHLDFPDKNARFFVSNRTYYTGSGIYEPVWQGDIFTINVIFDKGIGNYNLTMERRVSSIRFELLGEINLICRR